jgi:dihydroxyacetone kinase
MTAPKATLINDPDDLIAELVAGMVSAHPDLLRVEGDTGRAIVAVNGPRAGKVGIVVGGGSGHEPAFAGYVGRGLADAAPLGNIFASPSPSQIMDAGFAADGGAGVLFLCGNYTGDVMNFGMAAEGLAEHGITARSFVVTDDIASAPADRMGERRGIAGDFFVFKVAGAAADMGLPLDAVTEAARRANAATRTMGVALSACTMPQTGLANFDLPRGEMEIGMGIHGEPGIARGPAEGADAVADRLVSPILEELALGAGDAVAVLVNGLGSTPLMELYLLHRRVAEVLGRLDVTIHRSWVGNYCTSLDMGGASVTLMRLDDDLRGWLDHPCETPALRVGASVPPPAEPTARKSATRARADRPGPARRDGLETDGPVTPDVFRALMAAAADAILADAPRLNRLDGAIGDGDHGTTMETGWKAIRAVIDTPAADATVSETCAAMAEAFLQSVGASAGPLYASAFAAAGRAVDDRLNLDTAAVVAWLEGMNAGIVARGGAEPRDKTMVDAWTPAAAAARAALDAGRDWAGCLAAAADAAVSGAEATRDLQGARGRSRTLGARAIGHVDPGAASAAVMLRAWADAAHGMQP